MALKTKARYQREVTKQFSKYGVFFSKQVLKSFKKKCNFPREAKFLYLILSNLSETSLIC